MQQTLYLMDDVCNICATLRKRYFASESERDYRDSFVVCKAIDDLADPEVLFAPSITAKEKSSKRINKTLILRTQCYEKICAFAEVYKITPSEVCRRILYTALFSEPEEKPDSRLFSTKAKIRLLTVQMMTCMQTLQEIENELKDLEDRKDK